MLAKNLELEEIGLMTGPGGQCVMGGEGEDVVDFEGV